MLSKKYRLPIQSVLNQKGETTKGRYFFVKKYPTSNAYPRFGVVVSAKVAPKATGRNKLKRAVYAEIKQLLAQLKAKEYLILAQKGAYEALGNDAMISELNILLKK